MDLSSRVWGAGKILALIAALAGTYVLFAAASMRIAPPHAQVQVPI